VDPVSIEFFIVSTVRLRLLFVFVVLDADLSPRLRAPARVRHHAQNAVDAEPGVPEAGVMSRERSVGHGGGYRASGSASNRESKSDTACRNASCPTCSADQ
jgi:hypothetical protein